ncbi:hypothetical protein IHE45_05G059600 [Dioscorea alata]|uniref:Uncharacterized protein n=1 Tax=Dioscorea alata TaxID=55571 RepID=A0ACB7W1A6_DIOAL|nr:hypothetical protein IHE45_05G059600 [Dioscorea alata]
MRGYSKMNLTSKSSFMDLSEFNKSKEEDQNSKMEMKDNKNEVVLRRNMSCSSSSSSSSSFQRIRRGPDVLKRAFSMRRSSSVADGYCRIHDTTEYDEYDDDDLQDDEHEQQQQQQQKDVKRSSKKKGTKFFKACKSLFKF